MFRQPTRCHFACSAFNEWPGARGSAGGCRQGSCIELLSCHQYTASLASWMSIGIIIDIINKPDAVPS